MMVNVTNGLLLLIVIDKERQLFCKVTLCFAIGCVSELSELI